jgi:hypothetical protein
MKALKSKLATELLADPEASVQLRRILMQRYLPGFGPQGGVIGKFVISREGKDLQVEVKLVPKASSAS